MNRLRLIFACLLAGCLLFAAPGCKKKSNTFKTGVGMSVDGIAGNPMNIDVISGGRYNATFAQVFASLYTTAGDLSLIASDSTQIDNADYYFDIEVDTAGLLCPAPPCTQMLAGTVPVYNASVGYSGTSQMFVQVVPAALKAGYLYRLGGSNDYIYGKMYVRLHGRNGRGEQVDSNFGSTPILIRDFPG